MRKLTVIILILIQACIASAQTYTITGKILDKNTMRPFEEATLFVQALNLSAKADSSGNFKMKLPAGEHTLGAFSLGMAIATKTVILNNNLTINFYLNDLSDNLDEVEIYDKRETLGGISRLQAIENYGIYEAKKNEVIKLEDFAANKVNNNARQVFAKVPGLNIWESDFAGLQLDIATRGLGPGRTANFNTRQNGYDMSADALGYPESYYLPAMQAVERIEIVRGAASLQYGTQFGGMLNFRLKEAPSMPLDIHFEQAVGSFGMINSFASIGGTKNNIDYYGYYQYRQGDGWRDNSEFDAHTAFTRFGWQLNERLKIGVEGSFMKYKAQQPGGLTDDRFEDGNLKQSLRDRNWFQVSWNLMAATLDYRFSPKTQLNVKAFGLISSRDALGNLTQIGVADNPEENRTLIRDDFKNYGSELRLLHRYSLAGKN
ncbi:MAG: carboxypeptidase-like regulatory domain-containing protein, partial [Fulvivirga sp.]|uniref:carboxypeptidase-like regulatory domain-containing protein n=1 Tax=Fulvivirga sp. TaxID=1931237 RepID=UPI0032EBBEA7